MDLELTNRRALVLGASRGLGAAIAQTLAREGATVIAAARSTDVTKAWISQLPADVQGRVSAVSLDLGDLASVEALAAQVTAEGGVDILVNNSGGPPPKPALEANRGEWISQFEAMAANLFHITQLLLPAMQAKGWGRIITITSSGIEQPIPRLALSNGIRSAVLGWSKTLASEVAHQGITVNIVMPGRIQTERVDQIDKATALRENKEAAAVAAAAKAAIPMQRYGTPQEFADVVTFLASSRASYVTGAKIRIDGGQTRSV